MEIIIGAKGKGKTTKIIKLASENNGIIVTTSMMRVEHVVRVAREMLIKKEIEKPILNPVTYDSYFKNDCDGMQNDSFYFDDFDQWIQRPTRKPINAIALNGHGTTLL